MSQNNETEMELSGMAPILGISNKDLEILIRLASTELANGEVDRAIETLTVLTELNPFHVTAWMLFADAQKASGNEDLAYAYAEYAKGLE